MALARIAGAFYVLTFAGGISAMVLRGTAGATAMLVGAGSYVVVTVLFYFLFKVVNRTVSLAAAIVSLAGCVSGGLAALHLNPVPINSLVFFGFYCLAIGYLIVNSTFLPRTLGVLMAIGGLGWLTFASPPLTRALSPWNIAPGMIGEGALTLWLVAFGIDSTRWRGQANAPRAMV